MKRRGPMTTCRLQSRITAPIKSRQTSATAHGPRAVFPVLRRCSNPPRSALSRPPPTGSSWTACSCNMPKAVSERCIGRPRARVPMESICLGSTFNLTVRLQALPTQRIFAWRPGVCCFLTWRGRAGSRYRPGDRSSWESRVRPPRDSWARSARCTG